ncbi:hypothetical protein [Aliidiomarina quisquiliarum]|uniref:hypothetical protein n=1 Tax=Aliidiomarina quisquiliarum TaxID=2938947 RepID=UPI00208E01C1|nr:hypothetical protein [Aliidiomarina quisquiliarum]MCO4319939.1 hypothetical protein [Aliidiomarina quisquiliarum]
MKILITSVGSLVGQNILDVLEFSSFSRRSRVEVIGTNSVAASPQNFRCERVYLVGNTATEQFEADFTNILTVEKPDVILSGRDEDTFRVTQIVRDLGSDARLPYGTMSSLETALNKIKTFEFCQKHNLPFAETFLSDDSDYLTGLKCFAEKNSFPLIAKPIQGYASKGVFFVRNMDELAVASRLQGYMFQEYLGDGEALTEYFHSMEHLIPLFAHAPNIHHHSCHAIIHPDGTFDDIFISRNEHDSGVTIGFKRVEDKELERITAQFLRAIYTEGGYGPITVQFRHDRYGHWKAQEMNMRTNGNTFPRFMMGQDDLGEIINYLLPDADFPIYVPDKEMSKVLIGKTLKSCVLYPEQVCALSKSNKYSR